MVIIINGFKWAFKNFFLISTVILAILYARWFLLLPSKPFLTVGTAWILINLVLILAIRYANNKTFLKIFFVTISSLLFAIASAAATIIIVFSHPKVIDTGIYNGVIYLLVASHNDATAYSPDHHHLTKWSGLFHFEFRYVEIRYSRVRLSFDDNLGIVNIVYDEKDGDEWLIFGDADPPRYYTLRGTSSENYRFYPSVVCFAWRPNTCTAYKHMIYQCELDNTGCVSLPFQYTGEDEYAYIQFNEATREFEFYISPYSSADDFLIYSFGDHPRCHVEGCEILNQP